MSPGRLVHPHNLQAMVPRFELLAGSGADELPDEPEPAQEHGEADSVVAESGVEASASGPEILLESEPEMTGDLVPAHEEPLAAAVSDESPDEAEPSREQEVSSSIEVAADPPPEQAEEPSETPLTENGFYPLVRNARGAWRPGKGFSRERIERSGPESHRWRRVCVFGSISAAAMPTR